MPRGAVPMLARVWFDAHPEHHIAHEQIEGTIRAMLEDCLDVTGVELDYEELPDDLRQKGTPNGKSQSD